MLAHSSLLTDLLDWLSSCRIHLHIEKMLLGFPVEIVEVPTQPF